MSDNNNLIPTVSRHQSRTAWLMKNLLSGEPDPFLEKELSSEIPEKGFFLCLSMYPVFSFRASFPDPDAFLHGLESLALILRADADHRLYFFRIESRCFCLLYHQRSRQELEELFHLFVSKAGEAIFQSFSGRICFHASKVHESVSELPDLYRECRYARTYEELHGHHWPLTMYEEISVMKHRFVDIPRIADVEPIYLDHITLQHFILAKELLVDYIRQLDRIEGISIRALQTGIYGIIDMFLKGISLMDQQVIESLFDKGHLILATMDIDNLAELLDRCTSILDIIIGHFNKASMDIEQKVSAVHSYLEEHWSDSSLSLTFLANLFNISVQYLARQYIRRYGRSIQEDLQQLRIRHAEDFLLSSEHLSIDEIAIRSGYSCAQTFTRQFKKITGKTPGAYRSSGDH